MFKVLLVGYATAMKLQLTHDWDTIAANFVGQNDNIDIDQELTKDEVAKPF